MKRDLPLRGASRRDFVRSILTASAVLGFGPSRTFDLLEDLGGSALADEATLRAMRSVNLIAGTGALSWFTLVWPAPRVIKEFKPTYAYDDPTLAAKISGIPDDRDLYVRKLNGQPLWQNYGPKKLVTAFVCGLPFAHQIAPTTSQTNTISGGVGGVVQAFAAQAALQTSLRSLREVISIKFAGYDMPYGRAPGAPVLTSVNTATEMSTLFDSAASRLMGRLAAPAQRQLFEQYCRSVLRLTPTAGRASYRPAYQDASQGLSLVGRLLGPRLLPTPGQVAAWCGGVADDKLTDMAEALIITANAFKLGLTAQVNIPVFQDDPHGAFGSLPHVTQIADGITRVLQAFLDELDSAPEPLSPTSRLSDTVVLTVSGDTPKDPFIQSGWPDGPGSSANWIYVMSQGLLKPGWFGDVKPMEKSNFEPETGKIGSTTPARHCTDGALAGILYATSRGDLRRVQNFYTENFGGLIQTI